MNTLSIYPPDVLQSTISLPASKSIVNRCNVLDALSQSQAVCHGAADCDDVIAMQAGIHSSEKVIDVKASGTAMRFLTAYWAAQEGETHILTGSDRMKQRPIAPLVEALRRLGAEISYLGEEGFPPLLITGKALHGGKTDIDASISSQYVSAILMIAPLLKESLQLHLKGTVASRSYIDLTIDLMNRYGACVQWSDVDVITVEPKAYEQVRFEVESDWTSASYWYSFVALSSDDACSVRMKGLSEHSKQGDSVVRYLFSLLGVKTSLVPSEDGLDRWDVVLRKGKRSISALHYDFTNTPDLTQTLVVTCAALDLPFRFKGLGTLKIKETDRVAALQNELLKFGYVLHSDAHGALWWDGERCAASDAPVETYADHRMAMAFSALAFISPGLRIHHADVVAKSYPSFWEHLSQAGFKLIKD